MSPRLRIPLLLGAVTVLILALWWRPGSATSPGPRPGDSSASPTGSERAAASPPAPISVPPQPRSRSSAPNYSSAAESRLKRTAATPVTLPPLTPLPAERTPETETRKVKVLVRDYRAALGENPVGSNAEITRALMGKNARGIKFLDPAGLGLTLSPAGELLDGWGHPYFFHAVSGTQMEVRSAGPDGTLFTADDVIVP